MNKESSTSQVDKGRVIKFRVWDTSRKEWVHGPGMEINLFGECVLFGEILRRPDDSRVKLEDLDSLIALQFTGLTDKNGKEIYDQEILSLWCQSDPNDYEMKALVYWDNERLGWFMKCYHPSGHVSTESLMEIAGEPEFIESIGNLHQDKHLLE